MTRYSKTDIACLIQLRHSGRSWADIAKQLKRDRLAVVAKARRLRDLGRWTLPSGRRALGAPDVGSGRPSKVDAPVDFTFRVSEDVAGALSDVAYAAEVDVGDVVRAALTKRGKSARPFNLEMSGELETSPMPITIGATLPEAELKRCRGKKGAPLADAVRGAVYSLLRELGYELIDEAT